MRMVTVLLILVFGLCYLSGPAAQAELPPCLVELSQANSFQYEWLNQGTRSKFFQLHKQACRLPKCPGTKERSIVTVVPGCTRYQTSLAEVASEFFWIKVVIAIFPVLFSVSDFLNKSAQREQ